MTEFGDQPTLKLGEQLAHPGEPDGTNRGLGSGRRCTGDASREKWPERCSLVALKKEEGAVTLWKLETGEIRCPQRLQEGSLLTDAAGCPKPQFAVDIPSSNKELSNTGARTAPPKRAAQV